MRTVLAYPGNMAHAQHSARALAEQGALEAFVTTFVFREEGRLAAMLAQMPAIAQRLEPDLRRRMIDQVPAELVHSYPLWEVVRSTVQKSGAGPVLTDLAWDRMSHRFDRLVAAHYVPRTQAIQGFEYTALAAFTSAKRAGVARILHLPSLDSCRFEEIQRREREQWPELRSAHDAYFDRKFERRYARRCAEIALADVIIANSTLTAKSHIAAGADPAKTFVVSLGAPPPVAESEVQEGGRKRPLSVLWAGPFSLRKGAHYLLQAWQNFKPGKAATLDVYGQLVLPDRLHASQTEGIVCHGSVPQPDLFKAYLTADVLVFPTLSDGFGMVIAEAMAHGLPVITTDQAGAADLVNPENGIVVPVADPKALADALRWCLDNRDRLQAMRFAALETVRRHQWVDFRRDLIAALETGLTRAGYQPAFQPGAG